MSEFQNSEHVQARDNEAMEKSFETPGLVSLRVENASGKVEIETHEAARTDVLVVALHPSAEELVRRARVSETSTALGYEVTVEIPHGRAKARFWSGDGSAVAVIVKVPFDAELEVSTASASVAAQGRYRVARVRSASGEISLDEITGPVNIRTATGDIRVASVGDLVDVQTASGDVRIGVAAAGGKIATASGDVDLGRADKPTRVHTASGDVRLKESLQGVTIKTTSGDLRIDRAAAGDYLLKAVSGDIAVAVLPGSLVRLDAGTTRRGAQRRRRGLDPGQDRKW
jgi:hypothetical protein